MYLVDTNVFLSVFLEQENSEEASRFLLNIPLDRVRISEFSLSSMGVILSRRKRLGLYLKFVDDLLIHGGLVPLRLEGRDLRRIVQNINQHNLDFDDAYQYTVAEKCDLILVSFDKDFDKTARGRKTPAQVLSG